MVRNTMWCKLCRQDVPGLYSADAGKYCCPRCGDDLSDRTTHPSPEAPADPAGPDLPPARAEGAECASTSHCPPAYDGWELEERLRHIERVLNLDRTDAKHDGSTGGHEYARLDAPHGQPAGWHYPAVVEAKAARRRTADASAKRTGLAALTWTVLALGVMAFACGGVLLAWSTISARQHLWTVGMPIGLAGQIVLLVGLILQLDRLWHDNRDTAAKLHHVDEQLHDLNTATLLRTGHGPGSHFYSHMASGASPLMLLADLKSQLDVLAIRLGQEQR